MPTKTIHAFISGRVQGVCYRQYTRKKARELNLTGWVRNLPDKHVELMASGEVEDVHQLIEWLWQGPTAARVTQVEVQDAAAQDFSEFVIKR